jgi:GTP-binding protein Era
MAEHLASIAALEATQKISWADIVPVSVPQQFQLDVLGDALIGLLPEGPPLYPDGEITDEPEETLVAELIREAALEGVRDELPHSITVTVEEMGLRVDRPPDKPLLEIYASLIVERDSQKGIVIGHRGARLREIGAAARHQIEALLGTPVYLDLRVKVLKEWQRDAKYLNRLGF